MCWLPQGSTCIRFFPALPVPTVVQPLYRQDAKTTQGCFVHGLKLRSSCTWTKLLFCQTVPYDTSDRNTFIYPLRFLLLLYTCGCFACKCICAPCVYDTLRDYQMPWYTVRSMGEELNQVPLEKEPMLSLPSHLNWELRISISQSIERNLKSERYYTFLLKKHWIYFFNTN